MLAARKVVAAARPARILAGLALACLPGCVHQQIPPAPPAAVPLPAKSGASAPPSPSAPAAPPSPVVSASPAPGAATQPAPAPRPAAHAPAPKRPAPAAVPVPTAPGTAAASATVPAASAAPATLDLASLEERLRDTRAIGLFTKLSLKNQVDDLLGQFRAFYAGQGGLTLTALRRSYELLLMKVLTLLQDDDPGLASAVSSSREAIWAILSDRNRFNNL